MKKYSIHIKLPKELKDRLEAYAEAHAANLSEVIRQAIVEKIKYIPTKQKKPKQEYTLGEIRYLKLPGMTGDKPFIWAINLSDGADAEPNWVDKTYYDDWPEYYKIA